MQKESCVNRRDFIRLAGGLVAGLSLPAAPAIAAPAIHTGRGSQQEKRLSFYNLHTGESLEVPFWAQGSYIQESLQAVNYVLRDHRTDQVKPMDVDLLELLYQLKRTLHSDGQAFHIISGYRSPATNAMLSKRSSGVAKRSLHMEGMAVDIRLPGVALKTLRRAALRLEKGGVGFYPGSNFVHVDVGRVRSWG